MPFRESSPVEERVALFREYETGAFSVTELCARHGVSRETFYVWKRRRESGERRWFEERSHAAASCPHATAGRLADRIVATRQRFPHFGPKKIKAWLEHERPEVDWPAASTIGDILKREGLVEARRRRRRAIAQGEVAAPASAPNEEWAIDFKGWFRTRDGNRCDPLTITDAASRYLIEVRIVDPTGAGVRSALERVFKDIGLPAAIRSDNGAPFGSTGAGGLSALSVWWLKLGIEPRYIPPASPQDNGRHERMHRTLKAQTTKPPAATVAEQQRRFDAFRHHFNQERPHEALDQMPPVKLWQSPSRTLPRRLDDPWYDADHEVRRVRPTGDIKWRGEHVFVGEALAGELVGLCEHDTSGHLVRFCGRDLGLINCERRFLRFAPPRARLRIAQETPQTGEQ
ncbi:MULTISPECIES: integrase core domain-containing protein [Bradyrhizobium]|uniref:Integrase n=3 Tax=Bradyrhizobium TaxID=374 RepID=A0A410VHN5_9BRAD|nr:MULTISPECIES: integrase core domain-containing protein [Bradyrhizobium]MCG2633124.1 integrase core domain-containing protein [Bradyrhizobium zhengyangense]MCG2645692.1 integrase core domain-containing protein [Bradyrhizobium zhengyangense]MCG2673313.1 integrase core domain-containing protein [Bradyrhizobium zhengyangense]MDN4985461.1 integrase core domain-containing protein [Bradyrhizobium sp. WYCCWR 13022]MDN5006226.1 integrase core domain-containing protein [Bradyrhizobium sp. WYCCWR 1267